LSLSLNRITASLRGLASQAEGIAEGQLDTPLNVTGEDEVSQLRRSFEIMRQSLKARLDELNGLLVVVQGVAENLEMSQAVQPVLESALSSGACTARVVLDPVMVPELEGDARKPVVYASGVKTDQYAYLDEQVLNLTRQQDRIVLNNVLRPRLLRFQVSDERPEAVMAIALRHENQYYGVLWIAYDQAHTFSEEEVRYLVTLSGQAALAASNARLYLNAEIGRQRLSAILASTPDPVLVTDQRNRLLLANPAAWRVLGLGVEWEEGKPVEQVITNKELLTLLQQKADDKGSAEITLADGKVYFGTTSSVIAEGHRVGRVCILRDVTSFKQLDSLKSEFVATVSHDLRSPLTLMRGYASMLEIVGDINEQQGLYVRKIITGVDNMSRLVTDLLDLGRIEAGIGLKLEMVPVRDLVERVTNSQQVQATNRRIQLSIEIPQQTVPVIEADPALLQQALQNLVENALKYTDQGGKVQVRTEVRQNMMVFIVSDNGIGISPLDLPHLFEKFYRGAQAGTKRLRGTGLGLTIVKSIADKHGGRVWVESQLGKSSTFYFAIPIHRSSKSTPSSPA
jgi:PAS domain S-box-containing protein